MTIWQDFLGAEVGYVETQSFGSVRYIEAGKDNDEVLIFTHGMGGHIEAYCKNIVPLAEQFHVIAFDFIGHGLSSKPIDADYELDIYVRHLEEVMNALGIDKAHLAGESMGGGAVGVFAARFPDRVGRLVLITSGGIPIVTEQGREDLRNLAEMTSKMQGGQGPTWESVKNRLRWLLHEDNWDLLTDEMIAVRLGLYSQADAKAVKSKMTAFLQPWVQGEYEPELIPLEDMDHEILFLWTEHNPMHDLEAAKQAYTRAKNGQLHVMEGSIAHWPQYEKPEEFNQLLSQFLSTGQISN